MLIAQFSSYWINAVIEVTYLQLVGVLSEKDFSNVWKVYSVYSVRVMRLRSPSATERARIRPMECGGNCDYRKCSTVRVRSIKSVARCAPHKLEGGFISLASAVLKHRLKSSTSYVAGCSVRGYFASCIRWTVRWIWGSLLVLLVLLDPRERDVLIFLSSTRAQHYLVDLEGSKDLS